MTLWITKNKQTPPTKQRNTLTKETLKIMRMIDLTIFKPNPNATTISTQIPICKKHVGPTPLHLVFTIFVLQRRNAAFYSITS